MPTLENELASIALALPAKKRARLAGLLMESIETKGEKQTAEAWAKEAQSRSKAYRKGLLKSVSVSKALRIDP